MHKEPVGCLGSTHLGTNSSVVRRIPGLEQGLCRWKRGNEVRTVVSHIANRRTHRDRIQHRLPAQDAAVDVSTRYLRVKPA